MGFALIDEVGITYGPAEAARRAVRFAPSPELRYPVFAARAEDGTTVIVDELAIEKSLHLRAWYRTLRLDPDGSLLADSAEWGDDDAYGFLAGESLAILRVTQWEIVLLSHVGERVATLDLSPLSKRMPLVASPTPQGTFLVAFADQPFGVDVVEVDERGRLLWYLPHFDRLGYPGSVQLLRNGNILVADEFCHVVFELARDGSVVQQLGSWRDPGRRGNRLSSPRAAWEASDGTRLVADTRNDRVLKVAPDGTVEVLPQPVDGLSSPTFAVMSPDGNLLVCDAGNRRVVECDARGEVVVQYGEPPARRRWFSFPRSVETLAGGGLLVCDTAHDRVVVVENGAHSPWPVEAAAELFWPRCARILPSGSLLVADGRNARVLEVAPSGEVLRRLEGLRLDGRRSLGDPHDVRLLPNGHLLITDASLRLVVEADWNGQVFRTIGGDAGPVTLDDPHSAQLLENGLILVCDSGNDRVVWVGADGAAVTELRALRSDSAWFRFSGPRYAEVSPTGVLVVADTGNNRVLAAAESGELLWELASVPGTRIPFLNQPRWAQLTTADEVVVCDHCHHRVLRLRWEPRQQVVRTSPLKDRTSVAKPLVSRLTRSQVPNNPQKVGGLRANGIEVEEVLSASTSPHTRNLTYLRSKQGRLGHAAASVVVPETIMEAVDVLALLGDEREPSWRPFVALKYAQTLDGRIASRTGDSKWISGEEERRISHALRATSDAVLVGVGTVLIDDPQLTVRMVPGASPLRVILDSTLRVPRHARILDHDACTMVISTSDARAGSRLVLRDRGVAVHSVSAHPAGVDAAAALRLLRDLGVRSVLVEGGARVLTSFLKARLADRLIVGIAPTILGAGTDAVGDLDIASVTDALRITNPSVYRAGDDLLLAGDLRPER